MIKNIVFDFGNVLLGWNEDEIVGYFSDDIKEREILRDVIFKSKEWAGLDDGSLTYEEAKIVFKEKMPKGLKEKVDLVMDTWYTKLPVNADICNLIKRLKQNHYNVYALSNTHVVVYEYVKNLEVGKDFDGYIISAIEKMMKPNEDIYLQLFKKYSLSPEECFFIDDSEKNVTAGKKLGMLGHIFNSNNFAELEEELKNNGVII